MIAAIAIFYAALSLMAFAFVAVMFKYFQESDKGRVEKFVLFVLCFFALAMVILLWTSFAFL